MNLYADLAALKRRLGIPSSSTGNDTLLLEILEASSRWIDNYCCRHFYVDSATKLYDAFGGERLVVDDILTVTTFKTDTDQDGTFDDETWTDGTDFNLLPYNTYPKSMVEITTFGDYSFSCLRRTVQIVGTFGYGDGKRSAPYDTTGSTGTVASTSGTTLTLSDGTLVPTGSTILIGSEQMFVSAVSGNSATVKRAVNGTTATTHSGATVYKYAYPSDVTRFCLAMSVGDFKVRDAGEFQSERIGDYSYSRANMDKIGDLAARAIGPYVRRLV